MYLNVTKDGTLTLEEADDFKRFHISVGGDAALDASQAFQAIAEDAGKGHYWLAADAVAELSGKAGDAGWMKAFETMLEKSAPYGYADLEKRRIKAHVA